LSVRFADRPRLDAAEKRRARGLPVGATPVVFHLSLALAALAVGQRNMLAIRRSVWLDLDPPDPPDLPDL